MEDSFYDLIEVTKKQFNQTESAVVKELVSFLKDDREKQQQLQLEQMKSMERMMAMMTQVMETVAKSH